SIGGKCREHCGGRRLQKSGWLCALLKGQNPGSVARRLEKYQISPVGRKGRGDDPVWRAKELFLGTSAVRGLHIESPILLARRGVDDVVAVSAPKGVPAIGVKCQPIQRASPKVVGPNARLRAFDGHGQMLAVGRKIEVFIGATLGRYGARIAFPV